MQEILNFLVINYPAALGAFAIVGVLRAINKPLFTLMRAFADATPTTKDNELIDTVERSKAYSYFIFILDYLASVKVPEKKQ